MAESTDNLPRSNEQAVLELKEGMKSLQNLYSGLAGRLDILERNYLVESSTVEPEAKAESGQEDTADDLCSFLQYIPGIGTLYRASNLFIKCLQSKAMTGIPAALAIIHADMKDLFHFSSLLEREDHFTVHSLFDRRPENAFGRHLDHLMKPNTAREKIKSVVQEHFQNVNSQPLLVHHNDADGEEFHRSFLDNRVRVAKFGLAAGAVYLGLLTYENYASNSMIAVIIPNGFKQGNPVLINWKFDRLWIGTTDQITRSVGTFGTCKVDAKDPTQQFVEIEVLKNECYYWFTGRVYLGELKKSDGVADYEVKDSYIELKMHSGDTTRQLGSITKLKMQLDNIV